MQPRGRLTASSIRTFNMQQIVARLGEAVGSDGIAVGSQLLYVAVGSHLDPDTHFSTAGVDPWGKWVPGILESQPHV